MANNTNNCTIGGHLAKDSVLCKSENKKAVLFFTVANNYKKNVSFVEFKAFGPYAEALANVLKKGKEVTVDCRFVLEKKTNKNGTSYNSPIFLVDQVHFHGPRTKEDEQLEQIAEDAGAEDDLEVTDLDL